MRNLETKEEIRKHAIKIRAEIGKEERRAAEKEITGRLIREGFYKNAGCIYCYASFRDEVGTTEIIEESLRQGKRVAAPRIVSRRGMEFFFIKSREDLRPGTWSIPEPAPWCARAPLPDEDTLVILPGTAFDPSGARIGYGGGFYDTYLGGNDRCVKAALAFEAQCVEKVPAKDHDVRVEYIITEKELIRCSKDYPETR